ncbi:hypothetical protein C5167_032601 [Papaver somniferum]|uniref:Uncharacterized protein n=1 Tax=Papaver somniferum TaxID=3469 RepID=A0A4Y7KBZ9_PAPSO|nr:hypothetical protein C5167_032601 [Papaver somniferum]
MDNNMAHDALALVDHLEKRARNHPCGDTSRWQDSSICFGAPALASCCDFVFYGIRKNSYLSGIHGIAIASEGPTHQVFVVSLDDLSGDEDQACKKFRLRVEDVQRKNVLTNFWANSPRSETNRSGEPVMLNLARFESIFLLFHVCIICTLYCRTRRQMVENMVSQASSCDLTELVAKFIPAMIGKDIEKATSSIYPLQNVFIWKVGDHKFDKIIDAGAMLCDKERVLGDVARGDMTKWPKFM